MIFQRESEFYRVYFEQNIPVKLVEHNLKCAMSPRPPELYDSDSDYSDGSLIFDNEIDEVGLLHNFKQKKFIFFSHKMLIFISQSTGWPTNPTPVRASCKSSE